MSKRDREIRDMIERAWQEKERKEQKGFLNFNENDMRLLEEYYARGLPYGNSPEGFKRWLQDRD